MPFTRSDFLRRVGIGTGVVLVASTGALGARAWEQGVFAPETGITYAPWERWRVRSGALALVAAAILAANAHDLQPWLFHVEGDRIDLYADRTRSLGVADTLDREFDVTLGCALENLMLAALPNGFQAALRLFPRGTGDAHVARIALTKTNPVTSALYEQIPHRHTDRGPFDRSRALGPGALHALESLARSSERTSRILWFTTEVDRRTIGDLLVEATQAFIDDEGQSRASFAGLRSNWGDVQRERDGVTLDTQGLTRTMLALAKMLPASSRSAGDRFWLASTRDVHVATAQAYGIVVVRNAGDRAQRLSGGRLLERLHLAAAHGGIAFHHMNQMTERADRERSLELPPRFATALRSLVPKPWEALVTFRVGYGSRPVNLSPRRGLSDVLV